MDGILTDSRETLTLVMSTAAQKSAVASTSTNVQPTSDKGILGLFSQLLIFLDFYLCLPGNNTDGGYY